ncbi:MAG: TadE/TadG family type IV pilus assembly protein [Gemmataceae bacterium]
MGSDRSRLSGGRQPPETHEADAPRSVNQRNRRGILAMELLLVLPILLGVLLAMIEFSLLLTARQQVTIAAREAVRQAALGASEEDVNIVIVRVLGPHPYDVTIDPADLDAQPGDPITIVVSVPTNAYVPDLLKFIGFSLRNTRIGCRAVMLKE